MEPQMSVDMGRNYSKRSRAEPYHRCKLLLDTRVDIGAECAHNAGNAVARTAAGIQGISTSSQTMGTLMSAIITAALPMSFARLART